MYEGTERLLLKSAGLDTEPDLLRRLGTIAALLWIFAPACLIPAIIRIEPAPPEALYAMAIASVLFGLALLRVPWERGGWPAIHVTTVLAIVAITAAYVLSDQTFAAFFFMPAIFSAYAFRRRRTVATYLALTGLAIVAGLVWPTTDPTANDVTIAIAGFPILVIVACAVAYQRERLEASKRAYKQLALEAIRLSIRIGDEHIAHRSPATSLGQLERVAAALELSEDSLLPPREGQLAPSDAA